MRKYKYEGYRTKVEGEIRGVPFVVKFKRIGAAMRLAAKVGGIFINLVTLESKKMKNGNWTSV